MVLAATNRPSELDEAILRRLPQDFEIGVPERKERVEIVKVILKGETIDDNIDFDRVTSLCEGYTGSDLLELCKKAAYFPIRDLLNEEKNGKSSLKLDNNTKWWSMYACLLGFFYFFSSPFIGKTIYWKDNQTKLFKFQSKVLSIACCVFYSHCGNRAILKERTFERKNSNWFSFLKKEERNTWLAKFVRINELKDQVCSSWFAPVGSASDYPLLSKWVIYGELACNGSCPRSSDGISPIYSLWATFIGLYMANYVVERSTGWALTHPLSVEEHEKLKKRQVEA